MPAPGSGWTKWKNCNGKSPLCAMPNPKVFGPWGCCFLGVEGPGGGELPHPTRHSPGHLPPGEGMGCPPFRDVGATIGRPPGVQCTSLHIPCLWYYASLPCVRGGGRAQARSEGLYRHSFASLHCNVSTPQSQNKFCASSPYTGEPCTASLCSGLHRGAFVPWQLQRGRYGGLAEDGLNLFALEGQV